MLQVGFIYKIIQGCTVKKHKTFYIFSFKNSKFSACELLKWNLLVVYTSQNRNKKLKRAQNLMFILWVLLRNKTLNKCEVSIGWNYREFPFL